MRVLATSFLFPNRIYPNRGIFVLNRLKAVSAYVGVKVINPIPWFPMSAMLSRYKDYHRIPEKETIEGIEVFHPRFFSLPLMMKSLTARNYSQAISKVALQLHKSWRFQIVDMHWTFPDLTAGKELHRRLGSKQIVTVRGVAALSLNEQSSHKETHKLLPHVDQVITLSHLLGEHCQSIGVSPQKITTIRNGVDSSKFYFINQSDCRKQLGLSKDHQMILGIGYLTPNKGFDRVIESLPELNQRFGPTSLYLIGPDGAFAQGDCSSKLLALATRLGVQELVHFIGSISNDLLANWYNAADCFCLSSHNEGCPNVVLEALACGCPVVATDVGAVSEIMSDEFMGQVTPNSLEGLRDGLASVLNRQFERTVISKHFEQFDWNWCAEQVSKVYVATVDNNAAKVGT